LKIIEKRIVLLPFGFAHSRPTCVNSRWKMHIHMLTHVKNTSTWVNSCSIFFTGLRKPKWEKSNSLLKNIINSNHIFV